MLSISQLRIGPALLLFGINTPITDGIKLILKFLNFSSNIDIIYLWIVLCILYIFFFLLWINIPNGYIFICDIAWNVFFFSSIHLCLNIFGYYLYCFFILTSCYVYLSGLRLLLFSIIGEILSLSYITFFILYNFYSVVNFKNILGEQFYIKYLYIYSIFFILNFIIIILFESFSCPFDYIECDSELVAGVITEFTGIFFIVTSLLEIGHVLINNLLFIILIFGGFFLTCKLLIMIICFQYFFRSLNFRLKINHAICLLLMYNFYINFLFILFSFINLIYI